VVVRIFNFLTSLVITIMVESISFIIVFDYLDPVYKIEVGVLCF